MPLYLVRWPNLSCALVSAKNRAEVLDILDELDNPEGVEIQRYNGPLFLDITLATDRPVALREDAGVNGAPLSEHDIEIGDVQDLACGAFPSVKIPETDTGSAMYHALLAGAFPHLHKALVTDRDLDDEDTEGADVERVKEAVWHEALLQVRTSWRWASVVRADDPVSAAAVFLGTSPEHVRNVQRQTDEDPK